MKFYTGKYPISDLCSAKTYRFYQGKDATFGLWSVGFLCSIINIGVLMSSGIWSKIELITDNYKLPSRKHFLASLLLINRTLFMQSLVSPHFTIKLGARRTPSWWSDPKHLILHRLMHILFSIYRLVTDKAQMFLLKLIISTLDTRSHTVQVV